MSFIEKIITMFGVIVIAGTNVLARHHWDWIDFAILIGGIVLYVTVVWILFYPVRKRK